MTSLVRAGRGRIAFLAGALAALISVPVPARAEPAPVQPVAIRSWPISEFRIGSSETRFGPLVFVGGLEMTSGSRDFGALSAFRFLDRGTNFVGVADTGFWFFGRMVRDAKGRPAGVENFTMQQMVNAKGDAIGDKGETDAESIAVRDGVATVGFERDHRVSEYRLDPAGIGVPIRNLDFLIPKRELRSNRGIETIAFAHPHGIHEGGRVVVSEKSLDKDGNIFAAIIEGPAKGVFTIARKGEFDISDGDFLPNGDLLILERSYSIGRGVGLRLRRLYGESIMKGSVADGPILFTADMGYQIDNMEGLDVWEREDGALMVSLISDDNHSILQRNLYLEFVLHED